MAYKNPISGIYKIQSKVHPDRCYIGSAVDLKSRWSKHKSWLSRQEKKNMILQSHYNKYGLEDLEFSIVAICDREDLVPENGVIWLEQCFILAYHYKGRDKPYFNICDTAGSTINRPCSEEQKEKLRIINTGKKQSAELIEKRIAPLRGRKRPPFSEEWCRHIGESLSGEKGYWWGKTSPMKGKEGYWKGKKMPPEAIEKMKKPKTEAQKAGIKRGWIKRKAEGKIGERDEKGRFKKKG